MASVAGGEEWFDTQINAAALIAEINLLLEFISGRSDRSLGGGQQLRTPDKSNDYGAMLNRFFEIRNRVSQSEAHPGREVDGKTPAGDATPSGQTDSKQVSGAAQSEEDHHG